MPAYLMGHVSHMVWMDVNRKKTKEAATQTEEQTEPGEANKKRKEATADDVCDV